MALTQLAKSRWKDYFDSVSKVLGSKLVELEVASLGLGDQVELDWVPLIGLMQRFPAWWSPAIIV